MLLYSSVVTALLLASSAYSKTQHVTVAGTSAILTAAAPEAALTCAKGQYLTYSIKTENLSGVSLAKAQAYFEHFNTIAPGLQTGKTGKNAVGSTRTYNSTDSSLKSTRAIREKLTEILEPTKKNSNLEQKWTSSNELYYSGALHIYTDKSDLTIGQPAGKPVFIQLYKNVCANDQKLAGKALAQKLQDDLAFWIKQIKNPKPTSSSSSASSTRTSSHASSTRSASSSKASSTHASSTTDIFVSSSSASSRASSSASSVHSSAPSSASSTRSSASSSASSLPPPNPTGSSITCSKGQFLTYAIQTQMDDNVSLKDAQAYFQNWVNDAPSIARGGHTGSNAVGSTRRWSVTDSSLSSTVPINEVLTAIIKPSSGNSNLEQRWQITSTQSYYGGKLQLYQSFSDLTVGENSHGNVFLQYYINVCANNQKLANKALPQIILNALNFWNANA